MAVKCRGAGILKGKERRRRRGRPEVRSGERQEPIVFGGKKGERNTVEYMERSKLGKRGDKRRGEDKEEEKKRREEKGWSVEEENKRSE